MPRLEKIVLNVGMGDAIKNPKQLDAAVEELAPITGQQAGDDEGEEVDRQLRPPRRACRSARAVTLRGARMYEFLDRFISLAVPRIRDFRGLPNTSFDGRGNYTFGIKEQMIFPEIDYDKVEKIHGMDITFVTTAGRDDLALALLRELGLPFRGRDAAQRRSVDMAKTAWIERAKRTPKFKVAARRRCQRCGRSRAVLRKFGLCRICFRELALEGRYPGRAQGQLVRGTTE